MGDPLTANRMTAKRGIPAPPNVLVKLVPPSKWLLVFEEWTSSQDITRLLFKSGSLPVGAHLSPTRADDGYFSLRWTLSWPGKPSDHLSKLTALGNELYERTRGLTVHQGDEFPEEAWKREDQKQISEMVKREHNKTFLPALNMTAAEAMRTIKPGVYVAAPQRKLVKLEALGPDEKFPPPTDWLRDYENGYFVQIGWAGKMTMVPLSSNEQFWKDMIWYLREGKDLIEAVKEFDRRWKEIFIMTLSAFALALTTAPGTGGRADLGPTAFATASRDASRMIGREVRPPAKFGTFKVNPLEAIQTGIVGTGVVMQLAQIKEDADRRAEELELQSIGDSITNELAGKIAAIPDKLPEKNLRTGQLGEAIAKATLRLRGYAVVELQNASGHGVDLVAIKVKGNSTIIAHLEVKASQTDRRGRLSAAQKDTHAFVRDRLQKVVDKQTFYKNVPNEMVDVAKLLIREIDAGRPIGGILVNVRWLSRGPAALSVTVKHWKPPMPRATALPPKK
jgi:Holliday junction resolvase-like predicted endonuclease